MREQISVSSFPSGSTYRLIIVLILLTVGRAQICRTYQGSVCVQCVSGYQLRNNECVQSGANLGGNLQTVVADGLQPVKQVLLDYQPPMVEIKPAVQSAPILTNLVQIKANTTALQPKKIAPSGLNALIGVNLSLLKSNPNLQSSSQPTSPTKVVESTVPSVPADAGNLSGANVKKISINELSFKPITQLIANLPANKTAENPLPEQPNNDNSINITYKEVKVVSDGGKIVKIDQVQNNVDSNSEVAQNTTVNTQSSSLTTNTASNTVSPSAGGSSEINLVPVTQSLVGVNQKLTQVSQAVPQPATPSRSENVQTPTVSEVNQNTANDSHIKLTQIGQRLTLLQQKLAQAKLVSTNQPPKSNTIPQNVQDTPLVITPNRGKNVDLLLTFEDILFKLGITNIPNINQEELNLVKVKRVNPIDVVSWPVATKIDVLTLVLIQQALTRVPLNQTQNIKSYNILKCSSNVSKFLPPNTKAVGVDLAEKNYLVNLEAKIGSFLHDYTLADASTLCVDPVFAQSYNLLLKNNKAIIENLPIFTAYFQYSGFAKNYRIYFIDDRKFPVVTVHQGTVVVDLYRMMPFQVTFSVVQTKNVSKI